LFVRVHLLRGLCDGRSEGRLSELRRGFDAPSDARREVAGEVSGVDEARSKVERLRRLASLQ
jgi:hypothetical protein